MRQSAQLTSKLSLIVYATLLAAAVSAAAKESETRTFETKLGGQAGIAYRLEHLQSNYEVPARKLAQFKPTTPGTPAPLGTIPKLGTPAPLGTTPKLGTPAPLGTTPKLGTPAPLGITPPPGKPRTISPPEEIILKTPPQERDPRPPQKAAAEKAAAEKAAAEKALKTTAAAAALKAAEEKAAAAAAKNGAIGLGVLGGLVLVATFWLFRRAYQKASAPVQELLRKALVNPEEVGRLVESNATAPQDVDVTVFAPPVVLPCEEVTVQVIFHTPDREREALTRAQQAEPAARALAWVPLTIQVRQNDIIKVSVECPDATIPDPVDSTVWNGRLVFLYFTVRMPNVETIIKSKLRVFVNDIPAGKIEFKILVTQNASDLPRAPANERVQAYRKHFLSYASEDRVEVLKYAQFLRAQKMDYFQDLLSLSPGERWERRLFAEIDRCDVFALFWSHHAQQSEWVIREAEYALHRAKAAPEDQALEITPIILEAPATVAASIP
jgi:hypothetical protein